MRRTTICMFASMLLAMSAVPVAQADDSPYPIGMCYGETATENTIRFNAADADIAAAIHIADSYAATVAGDQLTTIRVALNSKLRVTEVTAWVRQELDGPNLAECKLAGSKLAKGWNEFSLPTPYTITDKGFYIGYTYHQSSSTRAIMNLKRAGTETMLLKDSGAEWADRSSEGTLCIEGLVEGDVRPAVNAALVKASMPQYFILTSGNVAGQLEVRNLGTEPITGVDVELSCDGVESKTVHLNADIPYGTSAVLPIDTEFGITSADPAVRNVTFTVTAVSGVADPDMSNNTASHPFEVKQGGFNRTVLIEEFTTERCPNCPRVAGYLHEILASGQYPAVEAVCHHSGYGEDWLTNDADREYLWFYGSKGTFAPAMMFDRVPVEKEPAVPYFPADANAIKTQIEKRLSAIAAANVTVDCDNAQDITNSLTVTARCRRADDNTMTENARLTLYLVEDNILAENQAGTGNDEIYYHQHVVRAYNKTWGQEVKWDGNTYDYTYTFNLDKNWNLDNLKVVAALGTFDRYNFMNSPIENCAAVKVTEGKGQLGVKDVQNDAEVTVEGIYDLWGNRLQEPARGVNIIRMSNGTSKKVMVN